MLGFAWLTLRQTREAIKNGRLEEAQRLLEQPSVRGHRQRGELLLALARGYVERGERQLRLDDQESAWRDLLQAEALQTGEKSPDQLRQTLTRLGLAELRALLQAGETERAREVVGRLRQHNVRSPELQVLEEGLRLWVQAQDLAARGDFGPAIDGAGRAGRLLGVNARFESFSLGLTTNRTTFAHLLGRLHEAAGQERWREVIELASQALVVAPQHEQALGLRQRAWRALEPVTVAHGPEVGPKEEEAGPVDPLPPRFLLWIDGVGGYLVCLGTRLTFGQAFPDARVDVPLVADVSRLHATLSRDGEGYVLEAVRPIQVNGGTVQRALLQSGDRVTLGTSCQFQFRLPVPGNATARLDLVSGHRLRVSVDAVLFMSETLILANNAQSHITAADLTKQIVLYRHKDGLGMRHSGEMRVNGQKSSGRAILPPAATVSGEEIGFAIEPA